MLKAITIADVNSFFHIKATVKTTDEQVTPSSEAVLISFIKF